MLFVGLTGHGPGHPIANRLTRLGAVPGRIETPPSWDVAEPSIFILGEAGLPGEKCWPGLHFVITTAAVPTADAMVDETTGQIDQLWADRLVPFEANLRASRRAPRRQDALLTGPDRRWPVQARRLIERLRFSAGGQTIRVDQSFLPNSSSISKSSSLTFLPRHGWPKLPGVPGSCTCLGSGPAPTGTA
jgi:hypothetical protein